MYVYEEKQAGVFTVGFFRPDGTWVDESFHDNAAGAAQVTSWLNGNFPRLEAEPAATFTNPAFTSQLETITQMAGQVIAGLLSQHVTICDTETGFALLRPRWGLARWDESEALAVKAFDLATEMFAVRERIRVSMAATAKESQE